MLFRSVSQSRYWVSGSPTLSEILDDPGVVRSTCGSNSGMDRVSITSFTTTKAVTGKAYQVSRYQMDAAQAAYILRAKEEASDLVIFSKKSKTCWTQFQRKKP